MNWVWRQGLRPPATGAARGAPARGGARARHCADRRAARAPESRPRIRDGLLSPGDWRCRAARPLPVLEVSIRPASAAPPRVARAAALPAPPARVRPARRQMAAARTVRAVSVSAPAARRQGDERISARATVATWAVPGYRMPHGPRSASPTTNAYMSPSMDQPLQPFDRLPYRALGALRARRGLGGRRAFDKGPLYRPGATLQRQQAVGGIAPGLLRTFGRRHHQR